MNNDTPPSSAAFNNIRRCNIKQQQTANNIKYKKANELVGNILSMLADLPPNKFEAYMIALQQAHNDIEHREMLSINAIGNVEMTTNEAETDDVHDGISYSQNSEPKQLVTISLPARINCNNPRERKKRTGRAKVGLVVHKMALRQKRNVIIVLDLNNNVIK